MNKQEILSRTNLFKNISDRSRAALADICLPKKVEKKQTLFFEGDKGGSLYILVAGSIQLYKTAPDGREIVIRVVKPGEMFAEVILFEQDHYPVNAVALKSSLAFMIPKKQFICLLKNENFSRDFFGTLMKKMRYLAERIKYLTSHDVEDRLFRFLEEHYGRHERIVPLLSKKDTAHSIGTIPETFSRLLHRLREEGKLTWERDVITVSAEVWHSWKYD